METLNKKYGLWTSIGMVVGVVIGSGVFFKADDVLTLTGGNVVTALLAWVAGALAMIFGALVFSEFAQRILKANGFIDYAEEAYGRKFGYLVGWFAGNVYYSILSAILAWVSALYTLVLFGASNPENSPLTWVLAVIYMTLVYLMNYYAPVLGGKFQVTTTIIKLIPLFLIGIVGIIVGFSNGIVVENFTSAVESLNFGGTWASAVVATAFAYDGWIVATSINSEIKDAKKNLPRALTIGTIVVFIIYVIYFVGIAGILPAEQILQEGNNAVTIAANSLFGSAGGVLLTVFVVISCFGTLNGLIISCIRTAFSLAVRNQGPMPKLLAKKNEKTNMPMYSSLYAYFVSFAYLVIWYGSNNNWFGRYIGLDEIPIVMVYGVYILLYFWYMKSFKDLGFVKRYILPLCAIIGACIILYGGITNPSIGMYLIISFAVLLFGLLFYRK